MKIILAKHFGTCFGVRDAIAQANRLGEQGPLTILGEIVHNSIVREQLRARGIAEGSLKDRSAVSQRVMITAHGASDSKRRIWREAGFEIFDGTCPLVRHAHEKLKQLVVGGFLPVVIGQRGHVEVNGLTEDFSNAVVLSAPHEIDWLPAHPRYGIISQTTQPIELVRLIVDLVHERHPESVVRFIDTVCKPTKDRQSALRKLLLQADVIVIVGGRSSNNTRQLVETCRIAGRRAIHIEDAQELEPQAFKNVQTVGLTAGTSTLLETVAAVHARLLEFANA